MDSLFQGKRGNPGIGIGLVLAVVAAVLIVAGLVTVVLMIPTAEEQKNEMLEGAFREGSREFDEYTNEIIITNDAERMKEARTALGSIVMQLSGKIRNIGNRTLTGLEVSVGMLDTKNELIKDTRVLVVPRYHPELKPNESIDITVNISGFTRDDDRANARWKVTAIKFGD